MRYPLLIDGGLSNQLEKQGCDLNHPLWTARLLSVDPESIIKAHLAYMESGASIIITSSYQATIPGFIDLGLNFNQASGMIRKTTELAREAVKRFLDKYPDKTPPLIAASIGPYGAYLADGSEYRGNYNISDKELSEFHLDRLLILSETDIDIFACETIPSFLEARILAELVKKTNKKAWMTFSCKDGKHINDGTPIAECIRLLNNHQTIFATGVNCTHPAYITSLINEIKSVTKNLKIVVYPNSGEIYDSKTKTWSDSMQPLIFGQLVLEWIECGADMVGGCCRIGTEQISSASSIINDFEPKMDN